MFVNSVAQAGLAAFGILLISEMWLASVGCDKLFLSVPIVNDETLVNCDSPLELGKLLSVATDAWENVSVGGWYDPAHGDLRGPCL